VIARGGPRTPLVSSPRRVVAAPIIERRAEFVGVVSDGHHGRPWHVVEEPGCRFGRVIGPWPSELREPGARIAARDVAGARQYRWIADRERTRLTEVATQPFGGLIGRARSSASYIRK